jgi:hypothetical protein
MAEESDNVTPKSPRRKRTAKAVSRGRRGRKRQSQASVGRPSAGSTSYPRHSVRKALRVPRAILDQNAGKPCSDREAAGFCGVKYHGPFGVEVSSALKYGFLRRPGSSQVEVTDLAKKVLRPQTRERRNRRAP